MIDAWFSVELVQSLQWLSLLSLLSIPAVVFPLQGRYRTAMMVAWIVGFGFGVLCLGASGAGLALGQPGYVLRSLFALGFAFTLAFGGSLAPMQLAYQEAELRKTVAQDI
jgi:hypothetical protein